MFQFVFWTRSPPRARPFGATTEFTWRRPIRPQPAFGLGKSILRPRTCQTVRALESVFGPPFLGVPGAVTDRPSMGSLVQSTSPTGWWCARRAVRTTSPTAHGPGGSGGRTTEKECNKSQRCQRLQYYPLTSRGLRKGSLIDTTTVTWNGLEVQAVDPPLIADWDPALSAATARSTERAAGAILRFGDRSTGPAEVVARLLLRAEGLASSAIEGLQATAAEVALAEATEESQSIAAWVADNLAVVAQALSTPVPLTLDVLLDWHTRLMEHSPNVADHHSGAWRNVLGWVGGPNPKLAAHVAAPAETIPKLMADLMAFINRTDLDPVTQAAIAHAHFETIHPFADGNGRIGRVLIGWIIKTRLGIAVPPPVSLQFAGDIGGYQSALTLNRDDMVEPWVRWFAAAMERSAEDSSTVMGLIGAIQGGWRERVKDLRSDSAGRKLVEHLPSMPVVSAAMAAKTLGVSDQAARLGLEALAARGIVNELERMSATTGRPTRWWAAEQLLDVIGRGR